MLPTGHGWVGPDGVVLFSDPVHARALLEEQIAARGVHGARIFVSECRRKSQGTPIPAGPSAGDSHGEEAVAVLEQQWQVLEHENSMFLVDFEQTALVAANAVLNQSEKRVTAEMDRYGMTVDRTLGFSGASALRVPETLEMQAAAKTLLQSVRTLKKLRRQRDLAAVRAWVSDEEDVDGGSDAAVTGLGVPGSVTPEEEALLAQLDDKLRAAEFEHERVRVLLEAEFPALARYRDEGQLERVTQEHFGPRQVAWDLDENLENIAATRTALHDDLSVFRLPQIVALVNQQMMVAPDSMRARIVADRVANAQPSVFEAVAASVLAIGLGLLAAVPTGGASVGVATTVTAAQIAGIALEGYLVYEAVRQYQLDSALSGTDPQKARALAQREPSLFWLAVSVVSAGVAGAAALKTFDDLVEGRRLALASRDSGALVDELHRLERIRESAGLPDDVGRRLTDQILDEHPDAGLSVGVRTAMGASSPAARRAARMQSHSARVEELHGQGAFASGTFHGSHSGALRGLEQSDGQLLTAAELERRGIVRTSGEGDSFSGAAGPKEFISVGQGESGFGTSLAYADAAESLEIYNVQLYTMDKLRAEIGRLENIIEHYDELDIDIKGIMQATGVKRKQHFQSRLHQLQQELSLRSDKLPSGHPRLQGDRPDIANYPVLFEFDASGLPTSVRPDVKPGGTLGGEASVHASVDLRKRLTRAYAPLDQVDDLRQRLQATLGHSQFEVLALEAVDNLPAPGHLGASRAATYKTLVELEQSFRAVIRAYDRAASGTGRVDSMDILQALVEMQ